MSCDDAALHRESAFLQEAGFRKVGLAPCFRLPAFFRAEPQHPRLRIRKTGSRWQDALKIVSRTRASCIFQKVCRNPESCFF
jgi:hypothetical protein